MRRIALAGTIVVLALAAAPGFAHGPSGSHEESGSPATYDNQVACGSGTATPTGAEVYAGANGVEVCNDQSTLPAQGRVIATTDQGGYIAADGDASNQGQAQGWARVDGNGIRCGDDNGRRDATHPQAGDTAEDCQP